MFARCWADRSRWLPFAALTVLYLATCARVIGWAGLRDPATLYWRDWQDQALYVRSARALAAVDLDPAQHYYALLYPLLGAPFVGSFAHHPFFLVNLACVLLAFAGFRLVASRFGIAQWPALALFAATAFGQLAFAKSWVEPWTTTPSAALLWLALGLTARAQSGPLGRGEAVALGAALALVPFARPGDALIGAIIAIAAGIALRRDQRILLNAGIGGGVALALLGCLFVAIYGLRPSPYMAYSAQYGFHFSWLGWKAYVLLVDPRAWFGSGWGLLEYAPWLVLGAAGMLAAVVWSPAERRPLAWLLVAVGGLYTVLMLAYVDLLPSGLWRYNNIHYFKWLLPLFGLFAVRFVIDAWHRPVVLAAALPVLALLFVRIDPVAVAADQPARMVVFDKPSDAEETPIYFATAWAQDKSGILRNSFDYHQLLVADRVRLVALRRPFAGDERWLGDDRVRAWQASKDPAAVARLFLTGPWPRRAVERYGLRMAFGPPCWAVFVACRREGLATR